MNTAELQAMISKEFKHFMADQRGMLGGFGGGFVRKSGDTMTGTLKLSNNIALNGVKAGGTELALLKVTTGDVMELGDTGSFRFVSGAFEPTTDNSRDLGSDTRNWRALYLKGNVDFQGSGTIKDPISAAATALSGTQKDIQIDIGGVPYYFTVYPTKA